MCKPGQGHGRQCSQGLGLRHLKRATVDQTRTLESHRPVHHRQNPSLSPPPSTITTSAFSASIRWLQWLTEENRIIQIREGASQVLGASSEIDYALKEQSVASSQIAKQVEVIASMSEENASAMMEAKESSAEMKQLSTEMHDMVDRFTV